MLNLCSQRWLSLLSISLQTEFLSCYDNQRYYHQKDKTCLWAHLLCRHEVGTDKLHLESLKRVKIISRICYTKIKEMQRLQIANIS